MKLYLMKIIKFFWKLSGDDVNVIDKCDTSTKKRFTVIGILVALIFIMCFISCYFAFTRLLQNLWVGILIGLFFAFMITNIYLFLLHTLSKTGFPYIPNKTARFISVSIRLIFIAFISVIVSKPIESLFFSKKLKQEIQAFKIEKIERYNKKTSNYLDKEINDYKKMLIGNNDKFYLDLIKDRQQKKKILLSSMEELVNTSNYYIQGIIILNNKFPSSWFITILVLIFFISPTYLKIFLHKDSVFYKTKHNLESNLVQCEYDLFKKRYHQILIQKYGMNVHYIEHYSDAPFNTKMKIIKRDFLKEDDLLEILYA